MKKFISVILACGAGGFLGTFIGLHFFHSLSIIGYIVTIASGGFIGYFLYDFEEVIAGIQHAWHKMTTPKVYPAKTRLAATEKWRPLFVNGYLFALDKDHPEVKAYIGMFCGFYPVVIICFYTCINEINRAWPTLLIIYAIMNTFCGGIMFATCGLGETTQKFRYRKTVAEIEGENSLLKAKLGLTAAEGTGMAIT
jgi:hypothetical protein